MKTNKAILRAIHVLSKINTVFIKSNTDTNEWHPINFQWIPAIELVKNINQ